MKAKTIKERWLVRVGLSTPLLVVFLLFSTNSIQADEIDGEISSTTLTNIPHSSEPSTLFFVAPHGDAISRTIDIVNTLRSNLLVFHTAIIIGFGGGDVKYEKKIEYVSG